MKIKNVIITSLLACSISTTAVFALDTSDLLEAASDVSVSEESLQSAANNFLSKFDSDSKTVGVVESLVSGLDQQKIDTAMGALKSLSSLDFSKEQLKAYGGLLAQVIPTLLGQNFDLENGEYGKYIGDAMGFFQSENFAKGADALGKATEFFSEDGDKSAILNGIVSSYAPMLEGMNVDQAIDMGKSLLGG